ncbi:blr7339 [Bradyrhizobium diazoefficiens USDA 110]|uniref:Blr7339 protein n=1 Tax=Bradyrhizobium diazoefficiens (strain JCM 10833 / BCRC 13528 / IAM 13628 / NBRC 14792 / USDA 110) TaxID=224911 RepID=Q89DU9_BRADU|nr:blr7339 [Bradyrhizobium diazoefficiens USDA 110]
MTRELLPPCPRQRREPAAFAIARVLVVDPIVRIDAVERDVVARTQHLYEDLPRRDLGLGRTGRNIGIVAGELDADRIVAHHLAIGRSVVDVLVVVAVGAVAMGRHQVFRDRPIDRAVGLDPDRNAAPRRVLRLLGRAAAGRARRSLGLVHDDVAPGMGAADVAPRRQPDDLQAGNVGRAGGACELCEFGVGCGGGCDQEGGENGREQARHHH